MDISNKTLVMLLLATLAITIFGTLSSLNKISGVKVLTGAWDSGLTTRGSVNLTITAAININFTQDRVNFGSGYVTLGSAACYLETSTANNGCTSFTDGASVLPLLLENQGNSNVKLNLSNLNDSSSLIGGSNPGYAWKWNDPKNDADNDTCVQAAPTNIRAEDIFLNISNSAERLNASSMLCSMFNASDLSDVINISFKLLVPSNAPAETGKFDTWTATAVA